MATTSEAISNSQTCNRSEIKFEHRISVWILAVIGGLYLLLILSEVAVAASWLQPGPIDTMFDSFKGSMLPIVMLVMGHYFGSRSQKI